MASTYTDNMGIEIQATGENANTWGDITNTNFKIVDRSVHGVKSLSLSGASSTIGFSNGALSDGQHKALLLTGSLSATHTLTVPAGREVVYLVYNNAGDTVTFSQSSTTTDVPNGDFAIVYATGSGCFQAAFDTGQITDAAITSAKLASNAVTNAKMADDSVNTVEIVDDAVTNAKLDMDVQSKTGTATVTLTTTAVTTYVKHTGSGTLTIGEGKYDGQTINITTTGTMTLSWYTGSQGVSLGSSAKIASAIWNETEHEWFFSETVV